MSGSNRIRNTAIHTIFYLREGRPSDDPTRTGSRRDVSLQMLASNPGLRWPADQSAPGPCETSSNNFNKFEIKFFSSILKKVSKKHVHKINLEFALFLS